MIIVRAAAPEDDSGIQEVNASATATLRQTYRPNQTALNNRTRISKRLRRLVATQHDRVIGTVLYYVEDRSVRVIGLGAHRDFRQQGVARALVRALEEIGKQEGATRLFLGTVKQTGNVDIFSRLGFRVLTEEPDAFSESDTYPELTEVEMEKPFDGNTGDQGIGTK